MPFLSIKIIANSGQSSDGVIRKKRKRPSRKIPGRFCVPDKNPIPNQKLPQDPPEQL